MARGKIDTDKREDETAVYKPVKPKKNAVKAEAAEEVEPVVKAGPVCGAESDSKFCPKCGAPMN